jgi:hypothetical protein
MALVVLLFKSYYLERVVSGVRKTLPRHLPSRMWSSWTPADVNAADKDDNSLHGGTHSLAPGVTGSPGVAVFENSRLGKNKCWNIIKTSAGNKLVLHNK